MRQPSESKGFTSSVISFGRDLARTIASIHLLNLFSAKHLRVTLSTRNEHVLPQAISSECCSIPSRTNSDNSRGTTCFARCSAVIRTDMASSIRMAESKEIISVDVNMVYAWRSGGAVLSASRSERVAGALNARP